jgi:hypothetical protein
MILCIQNLDLKDVRDYFAVVNKVKPEPVGCVLEDEDICFGRTMLRNRADQGL